MILEKIIRYKKKELAAQKKKKPLAALKREVSALPRKKSQFIQALKTSRGIAVIAEIKKKSPSKGVLRKNFEPVQIARAYEKAGASALSVLTDVKFFGGSADVLRVVKKAVDLPVLRKDFVFDEYQVYESRLLGADALLLIARVLGAAQLKRLSALAARLGLDVLFEVHDRKEARKVLAARPRLVGINNRDLGTFKVDLGVTAKVARAFPKSVFLVSESGIQTHSDLLYLKSSGAKAVLVGESLMVKKDPGAALKALLRDGRG